MADKRHHPPNEQPLKGWREIAAFFGRDQSTVRRWAATKQLPVFRATDGGRGVPVHGFASELEAWVRDQGKRGGMDAEDAAPPADTTASETVPARPSIVQRSRVAVSLSHPLALATAFSLGVAVALGGVLLVSNGWPGAPAAIQMHEIPDEARELYVRGSYLWSRRDPSSIVEAIRVLQQAIDIYPDYAEAHAALATSYNLADRYRIMSGWDALPKAERAARRAIDLNPSLAQAQAALAFVEFRWHWDIEASIARFVEALRMNPNASDTLYWYASALMLAGRAEEALPLTARGIELDLDSSANRNLRALALFHASRVEEAIDQIEEIAARDPSYPWPRYSMSVIKLAQGDYESYLENYATLGDMIGMPRYREVAEAGRAALAEGGVEAMAEAMIAIEIAYYERGEAFAWDVARLYAMIGRAEDALAWLRVSLNRHEPRLAGILADPAFRPIRNDPGFNELVADIGLPTEG